jgi:integrin alpha FG-GAP repeat containing protein 1
LLFLCLLNENNSEFKPYGLNYPTPFIQIESESFEYKTFKLYASQLSQSSHLSLQLPYVIFGLGSTPNFVDRLTVGVYVNDIKEVLRRDWPSIIPNSQLVINVNPRNDIQYWKLQLFLTPSKNILFTGISLGSTMICLIIVIIFLQYREKKIDEKERKLESQRFHFDGL